MGCHTWYKKLTTNNQEKIIKKIKDVINVSNYYWYEFTSFKDLFTSDQEWLEDISEYVYNNIDDLIEVNGVWGIYETAIGYDRDEPRIRNYPDNIITSANEMFNVMEIGLVGYEGNHCNFYWDINRDKEIRKNIIDFFESHLNGIIYFG